jgi:SAM-dependent methyltransferase
MSKKNGGYGSRLYTITQNKYIRSILELVYPPAPFVNIIPTMKRKIIKNVVFKPENRILDIGSGLSKGPGRWLWQGNLNDVTLVRLDICEGPNIDIVADATNLPVDIGLFDVVVLQAVPEHVEDIYKLFDSVKSVLKCGGVIYVEMPFLQGVHGDPSDYWRCTLNGLNKLTKPFELVVSGVSGGPLGSLIWLLSDLFSNLFSNKYLSFVIRFILRWTLSPFRYLDFLLYSTVASKRLASEYYILAKKSKC